VIQLFGVPGFEIRGRRNWAEVGIRAVHHVDGIAGLGEVGGVLEVRKAVAMERPSAESLPVPLT